MGGPRTAWQLSKAYKTQTQVPLAGDQQEFIYLEIPNAGWLDVYMRTSLSLPAPLFNWGRVGLSCSTSDDDVPFMNSYIPNEITVLLLLCSNKEQISAPLPLLL